MKTPADAANYYYIMAAPRQGGASIAIDATVALRTCKIDFGASRSALDFGSGTDATYDQECASPWLEITAADIPSGVGAVFPKLYFQWLQAYLAGALYNRPARDASPVARVMWALDCWTAMQYALMALPTPWGNQRHEGHDLWVLTNPGDTCPPGQDCVYVPPQPSWWPQVAAGQKLAPFAFGEDITKWFQMGRTPKAPSEVYKRCLLAVTPWLKNFGANWLPSHRNKDAAELSAADEPYKYALMQWRLWSAQDFSNDKWRPAANWPLGMGSRYECATLSDYIRQVETEYTDPGHFIVSNGLVHPNLNWVIENYLPYRAGQIQALDYDNEVRRQWTRWWKFEAAPQLTAAGKPDLNKPQPLTESDNLLVWTGQVAKVNASVASAAAAAQGIDPNQVCQQKDQTERQACIQATQIAARAQAFVNSIPIVQQIQEIFWAALTSLLGSAGAIGGAWPFYCVGPMFSRNWSRPGADMSPLGPTAELAAKIAVAAKNYENAGIDITGGRAAAAAQGAYAAASRASAQQGSAALAAFTAKPAIVLKPAVVLNDPCSDIYDKWLEDHPEFHHCLAGDVAKHYFMVLCGKIGSGRLTAEQAGETWTAYLQEYCAKQLAASRHSFWNAFMRGARKAGVPTNPLRG